MQHAQESETITPDNPFQDLDIRTLRIRALEEYRAALDLYDDVLSHLEQAACLAGHTRMSETTAQLFGIATGSVVQVLQKGRSALAAAAERLVQCADVAYARVISVHLDPLQMSGESGGNIADLYAVAADFESMAGELYNSVLTFADLSSALHDPDLTGDTHPYGDTVYGIAIPYLLMASDGLRADADAWKQEATDRSIG